MTERVSCGLRLSSQPRTEIAQLVKRTETKNTVAGLEHFLGLRHEYSGVVTSNSENANTGAACNLEIAERSTGRPFFGNHERLEDGTIEVRTMTAGLNVGIQIRGRLLNFGGSTEKQEFVTSGAHELWRGLRDREVVALHFDYETAEARRNLQLGERLSGVRSADWHGAFLELQLPILESMGEGITIGAAFRTCRMAVTSEHLVDGMLPGAVPVNELS